MVMAVLRAVIVLTVVLGVSAVRVEGEAAEPPTFAEDVAPLVFTHCVPCHRPNGAAPFSLTSYPDVRGRARQILNAMTARTMPPWKPEPGFGEFAGSRRLADDQIEIVKQWVDTGMRFGDPRALPSLPEAPDGWQIGPPDIVLRLEDPYRVPPHGDDKLRNFVIPIGLTGARYVRGWEFRTTNTRAVHHATMVVDPTRASRSLDQLDPEPGYEGVIPVSVASPEGFFLGWTPGQAPFQAASGTAWRLEPGSDLVVMLHLRPTGGWETVDLSIGLYLTDEAPLHTPVMIRLNRQDIDIPPGERQYTVTDSFTLPVDVEAVGIQPHAHTLARAIKGFATHPDGTKQWLIYIRQWDFHWQDAYRFRSPIPLPAGAVLTMEYTYDNSIANPANRGRPLRRVTFGQRTSDEMGDLWIQVVPKRPQDLPFLARSLRRKLVPQHIAGYRMMLAADPNSAALHDDLALLLWEAGDREGVVREFSESLRLKPVASAHYNVGNALLPLGRFEEAAGHFREALAIDDNYAPGHLGLGLVHEAQGRWIEAISSYRRALVLRPNWDDVKARLDKLEGRPQ
jgi:hypothetical protein